MRAGIVEMVFSHVAYSKLDPQHAGETLAAEKYSTHL